MIILFVIAGVLATGIIGRVFFVDNDPVSRSRPSAKSAGESQILKIWGVARTALATIAGVLITVGVLKVSQGELNGVLDALSSIFASLDSIIGLAGVVIAAVGSWFAKEKA